VLLREGVSLELPRKQGMFRLEARDVSGSRGGAAAGRGTLLGSCQLWVAAARDGSTLFWSHDRCATVLLSVLCGDGRMSYSMTVLVMFRVTKTSVLGFSLCCVRRQVTVDPCNNNVKCILWVGW
jgi:hypothetical protein